MSGMWRSGRGRAAVGFLVALVAVFLINSQVGLAEPLSGSGNVVDGPFGPISTDEAGVTALENGVDLDEYLSAVERLKACMGTFGTSARGFLGPDIDLSGRMPVYLMTAASDLELDGLVAAHDKCYASVLLEIDISYQAAVEKPVAEFYSILNECLNDRPNADGLRIDSPVPVSRVSSEVASDVELCAERSRSAMQ